MGEKKLHKNKCKNNFQAWVVLLLQCYLKYFAWKELKVERLHVHMRFTENFTALENLHCGGHLNESHNENG